MINGELREEKNANKINSFGLIQQKLNHQKIFIKIFVECVVLLWWTTRWKSNYSFESRLSLTATRIACTAWTSLAHNSIHCSIPRE